MHLASIAVTLFLVLDPFGNIPAIHAAMSRVSENRRHRVLVRELLISLALLLFFLFAGSATMGWLGVKQDALNIAGGILLFLIALGMVFPGKSMLHESDTEEPFIVPIAVPLITGPSAIALVMLFSSRHPDSRPMLLGALVLAWAASSAILLPGTRLVRLLGKRGAQAMERLMGLLLVMLSVQMLLDGIRPLFAPAAATPSAPARP